VTRTETTVAPAVTTGLRVVATLAVLFIVFQGVSAGEILSRNRTAESIHYYGAFGVHVFCGLAMIAAFLVNRVTKVWWPTVLALVVFALGFVQAAVGEAGILAVHVPLAMIVLVGAVWLMVWAFRTR
jgi:hypothetical protein